MKLSLKDWYTANELVFYKNRCYVPDDLILRRNVVQKYHDTVSVGHPGCLATQILVQRDYWWPGMATFIQNYVDSCAICQQHKINCHPICPPLQPISPEKQRPFSLIIMDFITDLPPSEGYDSIMAMVAQGSSKGQFSCLVTKPSTPPELLPYSLIHYTDDMDYLTKPSPIGGPQFASHVFRELGHLLGINLVMSTAHHPQTDGTTERANQEIEAYLSIFCANNPEKWSQLLPTLELSYNMKPHATQKESPLYLQMGYNPTAIPTAFPQTNLPDTQEDYSYSKKHGKKPPQHMNSHIKP